MKKIKIGMGILAFVFLLLFTTKVEAAGSVSLSSSKSVVNPGDEFTINANLSGVNIAALTLRISVDTSKVEYVSGPSNTSFSNGRVIYTWVDPNGGDTPKTPGTIASFKFRAKAVGKAGFTPSGDFYTPEETSANPSFSGVTVTIEEKVVPPPSTENNNGGSTQGGSNGSSTPSGGGSNTGSTGGSSNSNSSGSSASTSANANLKSLQLDVEGISPKFSKNTTNYYLVVSDIVSNISVNALTEDANAKVNITGNTNLAIGANKISIVVTAPNNKTKKTYVIHVTKTSNINDANANLENLAIENQILTPDFSADVTEYDVKVLPDITLLNILAIPQIEGAVVTITGHEDLQFGENIILITITAKDNITTKIYTINAYRYTQEEIQEVGATQEFLNSEEEVVLANTIGMGEIIFSVLLVGATGGVIVILIRKYRIENKK